MMEEHLAALEGVRYGTAFASGMSAVDACFRLLQTGDHIVCSDDVYGGVTRLLDQLLIHSGITATYVDTSIPEEVESAVTEKTRMIWVETPTNPLLKITDLKAISKIARKHELLFGVDSTFATPALLQPATLGADLVLHSTSKYISGHNQLIGGVVLTDSEELDEKLKFRQRTIGAIPSPFDCWLTMLGVKTLALRMERHCENALAVAKFLETRQGVERVIYPGLSSHAQHAIASEQMKAPGGMISFELQGGVEAGKQLLKALRLCALAESLGAVETMITHPASMTHRSVPREERLARGLTDGLVRLSVGIEHVDDILSDLESALDSLS
jgi:cystathionine gamma-lyase